LLIFNLFIRKKQRNVSNPSLIYYIQIASKNNAARIAIAHFHRLNKNNIIQLGYPGVLVKNPIIN